MQYIQYVTLLLFLLIHSNVNGQQMLTRNASEDTQIIERKLTDVNNSFEEGDNTSVYEGKMYYAPDSRFKILTLEGEGCGAYCNTIYYSYIYYMHNGNLVEHPINVSSVTDIIKIKATEDTLEYLIFDTSPARPRSVETGVEVSFLHLFLTKETAGTKKILVHEPGNKKRLSEEDYAAFYSPETACTDDINEPKGTKGIPPTLSYNARTQTITYEYVGFNDNWDCIYHTGKYIYQNGHFVKNIEN